MSNPITYTASAASTRAESRSGWVCAIALSLTLTACSLPQTGILAPAAQPAATVPASKTGSAAPSQPAAPESQVRVESGPRGEQLSFSLRLDGGRGLRTQAVTSAALAFVTIELRGEGLSPRFANGGAMIPVVNGRVTASIANLPRNAGALRLITLRGFDADENELASFELRGWYRSGSGNVSPALGRHDLLLGRVLEEMLSDRPADLAGLDVTALQLVIDEATGYDASSRRLFVTDPERFLAFGVTDLIPEGGSPLPTAAEITSNSLQATETVSLVLRTRLGRPFGEALTITLDDPGSKPARLASGAADGSTVSIPDVAPGDWTLRVFGADGEQVGSTEVRVVDGVVNVDQDPLPLPQAREFGALRVNQHQPDWQTDQNLAVSATGQTVVVWDSLYQDGSLRGIYARRFDSSGAPLGAEFQVSQHITGDQMLPDVSSDADGNFLIVWNSRGQDGSGDGIYARRYASDGSALGNEFLVNQVTAGQQFNPAVAMDPDGDAVIAWTSANQDGDSDGIFARRLSKAGSFAGNEFQVNQFYTDNQQNACVDLDADGDFVIGWYNIGTQNGDTAGIFARTFASDGTPSSGDIHINSDLTTGLQIAQQIALDSDGDFVMTWTSENLDGSSVGVAARRFDRSGTPLGPTFLVNTETEHAEDTPSIAMDPDGDFTIGWSFYEYDSEINAYYGHIFARRFQADGSPEGDSFQIDDGTHTLHKYVRIAQSPAGLMAAMTSDSGDGSAYNVDLMHYDADGEPF